MSVYRYSDKIVYRNRKTVQTSVPANAHQLFNRGGTDYVVPKQKTQGTAITEAAFDCTRSCRISNKGSGE